MPPKGWKKHPEGAPAESAVPQGETEQDFLTVLLSIPEEEFVRMINKSGMGHAMARALIDGYRKLKA